MTQNEHFENRIAESLTWYPELKGFSMYLNDISITTKCNYVQIMCGFVASTRKELEDIDFDDYVKFMDRAKTKEDGSPTTQGYQIVIYSALKRFSEYLYISRKAKEDYMKSIKRPKFSESQKTVEKREKGYLTEDEIRTVLHQFDNRSTWQEYRNYAIIMLMLNTGIRRAALTRINIEDYDKTEKCLTVTDKGTKVRKFILSDVMCEALDDWIEKRSTLKLDDPEALFICTGTYEKGWIYVKLNKRISTEAVYGIVRKYTACVEGKTISPHKLRATYGTQLYNKTHDIYFVQTCMGHNSPTTTERYVRGKENKTRDASEILKSLYS